MSTRLSDLFCSKYVLLKPVKDIAPDVSMCVTAASVMNTYTWLRRVNSKTDQRGGVFGGLSNVRWNSPARE